MRLTAEFVETVGSDPLRNRKFFDGLGLFLEVPRCGSKRWRFKYRFAGKEKLISLGTYPATSLDNARKMVQEAKRLLASGVNPSEKRKSDKAKFFEEKMDVKKMMTAYEELLPHLENFIKEANKVLKG